MILNQNSPKEALFHVLNNYDEFIVFDTETTGLRPTDQIVEIAAVKYRSDFSIVGTLHEYIKPKEPLSAKIIELTGITNEFLEDKPTEEDVFEKIFEFFANVPIGAYNTPFDLGMMKNLYLRNGRCYEPKATFDVLLMAREIVGRETPNHKLGTVCEAYGISAKFHSAAEDVNATVRLLKIFIREYQTQPEEETITPVIQSIYYWPGYRGNSRVYANTNVGNFYLDVKSKQWFSPFDTPCVKGGPFIASVLHFGGCSSLEELISKYKSLR